MKNNSTAPARYTQEDCTKSIAEFEVIISALKRAQHAPILDGTPFLIAIPEASMPVAHWLVLGTPYSDQTNSRGDCLRMQRGFDLCGVTLTSKESADMKVRVLARAGIKAVAIHRRDWEASTLDCCVAAKEALEALKPTLSPR